MGRLYTRKRGLRERLAEQSGEEQLLFMDPPELYDSCVLGVATCFNRTFVVYDREAVLGVLEAMNMTRDEAEEFHQFNQAGAWVGDHTPAFLVRDG